MQNETKNKLSQWEGLSFHHGHQKVLNFIEKFLIANMYYIAFITFFFLY